VLTVEGPLAALAASPWIAGPKSLLLGWILGTVPVWIQFAERKVTSFRAYALHAPFLGLVAAIAFASLWTGWGREWVQATVPASVFNILYFLPLVGIPLFGLLITLAFLARAARARPGDQHLRGAQIADGRAAQKESVRWKAKHGTELLTIAGVGIPWMDEGKHFKIIGATGAGKSTAIRETIAQALARGDRVVFADPDFGYLKRFYDARRGDLILNPFDERSRKWNFFAEIQKPYDIQQLARSLMPRDDEWTEYARTLFTGICQRLHDDERRDIDELYRLCVTAPVEELRPLLAGTVAEPAVAESNERMFSSMRMVMATAVSGLDHIRKQNAAGLSIRQWVSEGQRKKSLGALFLPYSAGQIAALRGMISTWMRLAMFETMEGPEDGPRIWFVIDELDALGVIDGLPDGLARLRKFGGACILGFQSIGQVRTIYHDGPARTIVENCGNTLILRCSASEGGGTAKFASELIGKREVVRTATSLGKSRGGSMRDARDSTNTSERNVIEEAVLPAEIEQLPDLVGYLKLASRPEWLQLQLPRT
jgi:type IV secretory pathway TraG/TraD family ATPase VirD4